MTYKLYWRIVQYAEANRHRTVWKKRLHALNYGATLQDLARIK